MLSKGRPNYISREDILRNVTEADILSHYFGITSIPCVINSPLRQDNKPSLGIYSLDGKHIYYTDLATKDSGGVFQLLSKYWNLDFHKTLDKIYSDIIKHKEIKIATPKKVTVSTVKESDNTTLECRIRDWEDYDIEYWESYGITLPWLKWAEVYPVSYKIIVKDGKRFVLPTDKYAYAYVEHKEGKVSLKIYQPFNKKGFKWSNKHDRSVISLWTKIPQSGDIVCICSSVKDALCLSCNLKIPAIALQGEGYGMSTTAIDELKKRFKRVCICLDNDKWGIQDAQALAKKTGFTNIELPPIKDAKDISDIFKVLGKKEFIKQLKPLFYDS